MSSGIVRGLVWQGPVSDPLIVLVGAYITWHASMQRPACKGMQVLMQIFCIKIS